MIRSDGSKGRSSDAESAAAHAMDRPIPRPTPVRICLHLTPTHTDAPIICARIITGKNPQFPITRSSGAVDGTKMSTNEPQSGDAARAPCDLKIHMGATLRRNARSRAFDGHAVASI